MSGVSNFAVPASSPHIPVLLPEVLRALAPAAGETYIDGTFGAGGYSRAILDAAACRVIAIDRDPDAIARGRQLETAYAPRLSLVQGAFASLKDIAGEEIISGIVLDIGVSSMQIDDGARGFSFQKDGPLDMRMAQAGPSAADVVNTFKPEALADLIYILGEEPRSRAIARAIAKAREEAPLRTTIDLVKAVERATGPQRAKDRTHPATRTFQALRIHVNGELEQLAEALFAAEDVLRVGGRLVVVTFHSLEDRIVKRFFSARSGQTPSASRHMPGDFVKAPASFSLLEKGHVAPSEAEIAMNPRARSAKLRFGIRTAAPAFAPDRAALGVLLAGQGLH